MLRIDPNDFRNHFKGKSLIPKRDISAYLKRQRPDINESTIRWHIHQLRRNNIILPVKRGVYALAEKPFFQPKVSEKLEDLYQNVTGSFSPDLDCIMWSTEWLHQFMVQQPARYMIIFETEREWMESLFHVLKDEGQPAFLHPSREVLEHYVFDRDEAIVVRPRISRSPTQRVAGSIEIPVLEKILVDLVCDHDLFTSYQGTELENIFLHSWKNYNLNVSVLLNYAKRRNREKLLRNFLSTLSDKDFHQLVLE